MHKYEVISIELLRSNKTTLNNEQGSNTNIFL